MRNDEDRIFDILEAITAIEEQVRTKAEFDGDKMIRVWCLHHIVVIGEAASRVSESLRDRYPTVPWRRIVAMRNAVVHGYFHVDWDQVWTVVESDLTPLRNAIEAMSKAGFVAISLSVVS